MKTLAKDTWHALRQNLINILLFELLYRGLMLPVYLQLTNRALQTALQITEYSYLTAENILDFLMKPITWPIAILIVTVGMFLQALEIAGLITAFQGAAYSHKLSPLHILWGGIQKLDDEIAQRNFRLGLLTLLMTFLVNGFYVVYLMNRMKPIGGLLQGFLQVPSAWIIIGAVFLISMQIVIPVMFTFHACMIEKKTWKEAVIRSRELLHKHTGKAVAHLIGCQILVLVLILLLVVISIILMIIITILREEPGLVQSLVFARAHDLYLFWILVGSSVTGIVYYGALTVMFYQFANRRYHEPEWKLVYPARRTPARRRMTGFLLMISAVGIFMMLDYDEHGRAFSEDILNEVHIVAHRGNIRRTPENTMAAMQAAVEDMADCIEVDVQMTKDGIVVLSNDANLMRMAGVNKTIVSLTYDELQKIDSGSWFLSRFGGEKIPTLREVLEFGKRHDVNLHIETKRIGKEQELPVRVAELIREYEMESHCLVTSTSLSHLLRIKETAPNIRTGYIVSAAYGDTIPKQQIDFISIRHSFVTEELVESVHEQGKHIYAWVVNAPAEMERLKRIGVDGIITDRPIAAREVIYENEYLEFLTEWLRILLKS